MTPEEKAEYMVRWRADNAETVLSYKERHRARGRERARERAQERREEGVSDEQRARDRESSKRYAAANAEKKRAHSILNHAVQRGEIDKEPCLFCDKERVEAHHHDYSLPLEVTWLCRRHHRKAHWKGVIHDSQTPRRAAP